MIVPAPNVSVDRRVRVPTNVTGRRRRSRRERADAHRLVVLLALKQQPLPIVELERLEGAIRRVDKPQAGNAFAGAALDLSYGSSLTVANECTETFGGSVNVASSSQVAV